MIAHQFIDPSFTARVLAVMTSGRFSRSQIAGAIGVSRGDTSRYEAVGVVVATHDRGRSFENLRHIP